MLQRPLSVAAGAAAGIYFRRDAWDTGEAGNPLGLPSGEFELPLVIRESAFKDDREILPATDDRWAAGFFDEDEADLDPRELGLRPAIYRLRIVNGCAARCLDLDLSAGRKFLQVFDHGTLLDAPVPIDRLGLAPGERADVLLDLRLLTRGSRVQLRNQAPVVFPVHLAPLRRERVLQFRLTATAAESRIRPGYVVAPPDSLRGGAGQPPLSILSPARCDKSSHRPPVAGGWPLESIGP